MKYFPLFIALKKCPILVVGGGKIATRKIKLLLDFGAQIQVVSNTLCQELKELNEQKKIFWISKNFHKSQLKKVFLVIAATNNNILNETVFKNANESYRLVNVVDDKKKCSIIFSSIIDRYPLIIAISSNGIVPILTRLLREKIESLISFNIGKLITIIQKWKTRINQKFKNIFYRRRFFEEILNGNFSSLIKNGNIKEAENLLSKEIKNKKVYKGAVIILESTQGSKNLLTLRGLQALQEADIVLYDSVIDKELLNLIRRDAQIISVNFHKLDCFYYKKNIDDRLIKLAQQNKRVVRLIFGNFIISIENFYLNFNQLKKSNIFFEFIPGVSIFNKYITSSLLHIALTNRYFKNDFLFINNDHNNFYLSSYFKNKTLIIPNVNKKNIFVIIHTLISVGYNFKKENFILINSISMKQIIFLKNLKNLKKISSFLSKPIFLIVGKIINNKKNVQYLQKVYNPSINFSLVQLN
ncbi:siroheme synthase family protein [Candidatus Tachikawaea gelatinosa]|uniref:precorrin-2 dehydrogenase n=1 Tax=Candidatus Tachikawaea gelatinosa TaxID=1410383 RepID=A0A090BWG0_9ENTR|nr:NAD(P)-dependent oxidoreductase [Candidatus Tachikawaea gelatinosa]BAP58541.1 siroheme synthase [Candidatus Tachikawaea gelatinosa]